MRQVRVVTVKSGVEDSGRGSDLLEDNEQPGTVQQRCNCHDQFLAVCLKHFQPEQLVITAPPTIIVLADINSFLTTLRQLAG
jgi:hypothetical protein